MSQVMLRIPFRVGHRRMNKAEGPGGGPQGRINKLRKIVNDLFRYERVEDKSFHLDEARGYAELIVQEAQKHGDKHKPTMDMLNYWIVDKDLIHKLFKVLLPRYLNFQTSITSVHRIPTVRTGKPVPLGIMELKGNPLPRIEIKQPNVKHSLVNVLLNSDRQARERKLHAMQQELLNKSEPGSHAVTN